LRVRLAASGIRCLALAADNGPAWALVDLAALAAGICVVPLPGFFSPSQIRHALTRSGAQALLAPPSSPLEDLATGAAQEWSIAGQRLSLLALAGDPSTPLPEAVHKITFTSGTTGEPKGVMLAWRQIQPVVESLAGAVEAGPGHRHLALAPLSILLENIAGLYVPLWCGATAVLPPLAEVGLRGSSRLDVETMARALTQWRANSAIFFPQTLQALVEWLESGHPAPDSLAFAAVGGAPVSSRLLARARALGLPVYEGYGLSECASVVCLNTPVAQRPGSVGRPLPHVRLRLSGDGEVLVAGAGFLGYLGEPAQPSEWWPTGDLGRLDRDGYLYLEGRRRNVFCTAFGRNVAPEWVERELTLEPAIAQAALFGEARPWNLAVIVPAPGADPVAVEAALERVNAGLPDYARAQEWLTAEAPFSLANGELTGTGRIRREAIWSHYAGVIEPRYRQESIS